MKEYAPLGECSLELCPLEPDPPPTAAVRNLSLQSSTSLRSEDLNKDQFMNAVLM